MATGTPTDLLQAKSQPKKAPLGLETTTTMIRQTTATAADSRAALTRVENLNHAKI